MTLLITTLKGNKKQLGKTGVQKRFEFEIAGIRDNQALRRSVKKLRDGFFNYFFVREVSTIMKVSQQAHPIFTVNRVQRSVQCTVCKKSHCPQRFFSVSYIFLSPRALAFWLVHIPAANTLLATSTNSTQHRRSLYRLLYRALLTYWQQFYLIKRISLGLRLNCESKLTCEKFVGFLHSRVLVFHI